MRSFWMTSALLLACSFLMAQEPPSAIQEDKETATPPTEQTTATPQPQVEEAPATPTIEDRVKALEERAAKAEAAQAQLAEENKKLSDELTQKKATDEAAQAVPEKEEEKPVVSFQPYGFIELSGWANDALFTANNMPLYVTDKGRSSVGVTARSTRIGTKIAFPRIETVTLSGLLEADLNGTSSDSGLTESSLMPRLRIALIDISKTWDKSTLGAKAGQTYAVACPSVFPGFISPSMAWGMGNTWQRMPLLDIYFIQKFAETFAFTAEVAAARAMTGASANRATVLEVNIDAGDASNIPQIQGQLSLKGKISVIDLFVAAAGAWGREKYKSGVYLNNKKDVKYIGDTVDVGYVTGALKLSHEYAEIAGKFWWGQNVDVFGSFGGALITEDVDATTKRVVGSQRVLGWWAQLTMKPVSGLALHVGYGAEDPDEKQKGASPTYYENDSLWVSAFYTLFDRLVLGFQWTQLQTKNLKKSDGSRSSQTGNSIMGQVRLLF